MAKMKEEEIQNLEETVLRLHTYLRSIQDTQKYFKRIYAKIEKEGVSIMTKEDKEQLKELHLFDYYHGKMYAYMYCLLQLGYGEVPHLIYRLRGVAQNKSGSKITETPFRLPIERPSKEEMERNLL